MFDAVILTACKKTVAGRSMEEKELCAFIEDVLAKWDAWDGDEDDFVDETVLALAGEDMDKGLDAAELIDAILACI